MWEDGKGFEYGLVKGGFKSDRTEPRYHINHLTKELQKVYPKIMGKIKFELSKKHSKPEKSEQGKSGFIPEIARWVVERSNARMERCRILVKNMG